MLGLLLAAYLGITPGGTRGNLGIPRIEVGSVVFRANSLLPALEPQGSKLVLEQVT